MLAGITLGVAGILSLIVVCIFEGMFKREAPFGEMADYIIGLISGVGIAALDYFIFIPIFFDTEWLRILGSILEGAFGAWLVLWLIRQIARPPLRIDDTA